MRNKHLIRLDRRQVTLFVGLVLASLSFRVLRGCGQGAVNSARHQGAKSKPPFTRIRNVVYGIKDGLSLTMDVFTPRKNANRKGILWLVSGGWYSSSAAITVPISKSMINTLVQRGYTVFAVVHSSQPRFNITEMLPDLQRAARYVRYHSATYRIDPNHIGIAGASSGGHLALLQSLTADDGNAKSKDAVDRTSSHVQAVACFFPPTDFLNYGQPGAIALGCGLLKGFPAPFDFHENDVGKKLEIGREISPINHVDSTAPPTLIIHGDSDLLVPTQQGKTMIAKLKMAHVPARLILKIGGGHGWPDIDKDMPKIADWFDEYLLKVPKQKNAGTEAFLRR